MPDPSRSAQALQRQIETVTAPIETLALSLIEQATISGVTAGAGAAPMATTADDESVQVLEPYGVASSPPGQATALLLAPGGELTDLVALNVSSLAGRPATDAGDVALWTAAGHRFELDDDGGILITAKDGQTIELDDTGDIIVTPAPGFKARIGGAGASQPAAKATVTRSEMQKIVTAIGAVIPVGADTGALIVAAILAAFAAPPLTVANLASSVVEVVE